MNKMPTVNVTLTTEEWAWLVVVARRRVEQSLTEAETLALVAASDPTFADSVVAWRGLYEKGKAVLAKLEAVK